MFVAGIEFKQTIALMPIIIMLKTYNKYLDTNCIVFVYH